MLNKKYEFLSLDGKATNIEKVATIIFDLNGVILDEVSKLGVIKSGFQKLGWAAAAKLGVKYALNKLSAAEVDQMKALIAEQVPGLGFVRSPTGNKSTYDIIRSVANYPSFLNQHYDLRVCSNMNLTPDANKELYRKFCAAFQNEKKIKYFQRFYGFDSMDVRNRFCLLNPGQDKSEYYRAVVASDKKAGRDTFVVEDTLSDIKKAFEAGAIPIFITDSKRQARRAEKLYGARCYEFLYADCIGR